LFRGVFLKNFPGVHDLETFEYRTNDGQVILFHFYECFGLYESEGTAQAQLKRVLKHHETRIKQGAYSLAHWGPGTIPKVTSVIEEVIPVWTPIIRTLKTHD
jgi:hypothetical protein